MLYETNKELFQNTECLPIAFDITFNYVPRMCALDKCSISPINLDATNQKDKFCNESFNKICHCTKDKICTFVLYTADLTYTCPEEEDCEILNALK